MAIELGSDATAACDGKASWVNRRSFGSKRLETSRNKTGTHC